jgi:hypothetical protein
LILSTEPYFYCAEDNCEEETKTEQSAKKSKDDHPNYNICSPFFTCATCTGFTLPHKVLLYLPLVFGLAQFDVLSRSVGRLINFLFQILFLRVQVLMAANHRLALLQFLKGLHL